MVKSTKKSSKSPKKSASMKPKKRMSQKCDDVHDKVESYGKFRMYSTFIMLLMIFVSTILDLYDYSSDTIAIFIYISIGFLGGVILLTIISQRITLKNDICG
jgi:hypothetical protein